MSSTAIVALFLGSAVISAAALISVSPTGVMADSMQGQLPGAVQTVAATGPQSGSSPAAGAATILKVPPTAAPPLPAASAQLLAPSREPFPASASPAATSAGPQPTAPCAGRWVGTVASASAAAALSGA